MSNERPNYGWFNAWGPMTPLMEQWAAAARMWADAWSAFFPGVRQAWPGAPAGFSTATPPAVSVAVSSQSPTEVTVNLLPGSEWMELRADSFQPPFHSSVFISQKPGGIYVRVEVADNQTAGTYHGAIRAADGSIVGKLTVTIAQPASQQPS